MVRKRNNPHKSFMIFNAVLFIAVLVITGIFLYLAYTFKRDANKKVTYKGTYRIEVSGDFADESLSVYVNDSLLLNRVMPDTLIHLEVNRFTEEHTLMVVDNRTDNVTLFNLNKEGSKVHVRKGKDGIVFDETPNTF